MTRHKQDGRKETIVNLLKKGPLSPTQILKFENKYPPDQDWIATKKTESKKKYENELRNLSKTYLSPLKNERLIFGLPISGNIDYSRYFDKNKYSMHPKEFFEMIIGTPWEKSERTNRNPNKIYYFYTPKSAKWKKIFEEVVIEDILNRFQGYIENEKEIIDLIKKLLNLFQKIEMLPKQRYKIKSVGKRDFLKQKGKMFGFDCIERDFSEFLIPSESPLEEIKHSFATELMSHQERLHKLLFTQTIKIENVLENEFKKRKLTL